jgi:hypothetical protein
MSKFFNLLSDHYNVITYSNTRNLKLHFLKELRLSYGKKLNLGDLLV